MKTPHISFVVKGNVEQALEAAKEAGLKAATVAPQGYPQETILLVPYSPETHLAAMRWFNVDPKPAPYEPGTLLVFSCHGIDGD